MFSPDPIVSVNILLDNKDVGVMDHVTGPLYVAKWQPLDYSNGIHSITVTAKVCGFHSDSYIFENVLINPVLQDKGGHVTTVTQPFSLDTEPISIGRFEAFVLQANLPTTVSSCYFITIYIILNVSSVVEDSVYVAMVTAYWTAATCQMASKRYMQLKFCTILSCLCTGLSSDYEILARANSIYFPLLFCLLNFGIGMSYVATNM